MNLLLEGLGLHIGVEKGFAQVDEQFLARHRLEERLVECLFAQDDA